MVDLCQLWHPHSNDNDDDDVGGKTYRTEVWVFRVSTISFPALREQRFFEIAIAMVATFLEIWISPGIRKTAIEKSGRKKKVGRKSRGRVTESRAIFVLREKLYFPFLQQ